MSCIKGGICEHGGCSDCQGEPNIKLGQDWLVKGANMSTDAQIKTGLKLSEAIKLLEENEGALFKPDELADAQYSRLHNATFILFTTDTYSVKLPPPKSVSVTRADVERAFYAQDLSILSNAGILEALCKELGL